MAALYAAGGTWCLTLLADTAERSPALFAEALGEAVAMGAPAAVEVLLAAGAEAAAFLLGVRSHTSVSLSAV